jgi:serine/threonine protein phosphatase PrpC
MSKKRGAPDESTSLNAAVLSEVGRVRQANEDAYALLPEQGLFIVSDGIGGRQAGEIASRIVVEVLPQMLAQRLFPARASQASESTGVLRDTIVELSQQIRRQASSQTELAGMGATLVLACVRGEQALIAHMGDSRAYLYRRRKLRQLTDDHSIIAALLRHGAITREEADGHPAKGRLSRYVGMEGDAYPDVRVIELARGDRILLCSDGLTGMVADNNIAKLLGEPSDPELACRALVEAADTAGGRDNITVLVIDWHGGAAVR